MDSSCLDKFLILKVSQEGKNKLSINLYYSWPYKSTANFCLRLDLNLKSIVKMLRCQDQGNSLILKKIAVWN